MSPQIRHDRRHPASEIGGRAGCRGLESAPLLHERGLVRPFGPEPLKHLLDWPAAGDGVHEAGNPLLDGVELAGDDRPARLSRAPVRLPAGDRTGYHVAEDVVVETHADRIEDGGVEDLVAEER